jgi:hypothetical protein
MNSADRNADKRAEYRIEQRAREKAKQFARKLAGLLNGELDLHYTDGEGHRIFVAAAEQGACCRWLAEFLETWKKAGYRWSRWPHRKKIQAEYVPSITEGGKWPKLGIERKAAAPIEGDVPIHGGPQLDEEEIDEILRQGDEVRGWHYAVRPFVEYMTSPAFDTICRCDSPACGSYFVYDRPNQTFCSGRCAKAEARRHSTVRTRARDRQRTLKIVQAEIDGISRRGPGAHRVFLLRWGRWERGIASEANGSLVDAGLEPIQSNWITRAVRIGELKPPRLKPPEDE